MEAQNLWRWDDKHSGGHWKIVGKILLANYAYAALLKNTTVLTWGENHFDGESSGVGRLNTALMRVDKSYLTRNT